MKILLSKMPEWLKEPLRRTKKRIKALAYYGKGRSCPVCCKTSSHFKPFGVVPRKDAECAHCGSLERDRLTWLFIQKKTDLFNDKPKKMLHVAPESVFESIFSIQLGSHYLTADLFNPRAMVKMDICDIQYPDGSFDVVYCSHVLEHVVDDKQAMREFYRVLETDGWAILNVPITREKTFEDPSITTPLERLEVFGQRDHLRCYGTDYIDRLRESGFTVAVTKVCDLANEDEAIKMGLTQASGEVYYCTKQRHG